MENTEKNDKQIDNIIFRKLVPKDYSQYIGILKSMGKKYQYTLEKFERQLLILKLTQKIIVGEIDGEIVCTGRYIREDDFGEDIGRIDSIFVKKEIKDIPKIKTQLLSGMLNLLKYEDITRMIISCRKDEYSFYKDLGFEKADTEIFELSRCQY